VKIKPMIFNTEMVQALLGGRKTQTRRPINISDGWELKDQHICRIITPKPGRWGAMQRRALHDSEYEHQVTPTPAMPGDLIYVRETFRTLDSDDECDCEYPCSHPGPGSTVYFADNQELDRKWKPSIHMPRRASRLTLKVTGVRVERVQDISEQDAVKEGVFTDNPPHINWASADFSRIWHLIYPGSWERNDWVWVIDFEVIRQNVDEYLKRQEHAA